MPTFKYKCKDCKKEFDFLVMAGIDEVIKCTHCNSLEVTKIITAPNLKWNKRAFDIKDVAMGCVYDPSCMKEPTLMTGNLAEDKKRVPSQYFENKKRPRRKIRTKVSDI